MLPVPPSRFLLGLLSLGLTLPLLAAPPTPPVVPGYARFFITDKTDAARGGRLLLSELNCIGCHKADDALTPVRKQGPVLDGVGNRVHGAWLKRYLADPHGVKPGTTMPDLLAGDPDRAQKAEALAHFLASTGALRQQRPETKAVAEGRTLYSRVGCIACHGTRKANGEPDQVLPTSVPLGDLKAKYSLFSLSGFLAEPHRTRPSGRMPRLLANPKEAQAVANFLLQGLKVDLSSARGATRYTYYEGTWNKLPDFTTLKPKGKGDAVGFDVGVARRASNFALKFDGVVKIPRKANYTFSLTSDDGSQLFIDGKRVVNNDGVHPPSTQTGRIQLEEGIHTVTVTFFQGGGGAELEAFIEAPGFGRENLGDIVAISKEALEKAPKKPADPNAFTPQPELIKQGRDLFGSLGCASCHDLKVNGKKLPSTLKAAPLAKLQATKGCLADKAVKGTPWYDLSAGQRTALVAAMAGKAPKRTPAELTADTMLALNCYTCHVRDKVGGPQDELNKTFLTVQPEMGDEGRLPPPLDGVGAKLTPEYLRQILDRGANDRPYMYTRMPGFGNANAGHLVAALASLDSLPVIPPVAFKESPGRIKAQARHLVGGMAFGCIKCHTFAGKKAEGVQGIDMTLMPKRLRRDWFHAYITDPQKIRPGTRMPSAYMDGKSILPNILDGTARTQIEAMWLYLQDGNKARTPYGVGNTPIPLIPTTTAILYRNFIEGAGHRGIGVGYPEKANLAFDANQVRLAMLWQGAFMDAARHWTGRGQGAEGPLGDNILALPGGVAFAVLEKPDTAWPGGSARDLGYRFRGYRLTPDDRPTFLYSGPDFQVEDFPNAMVNGKAVGLKRDLTVSATKAINGLTYRAAVGKKIEPLDGGWFRIDGQWRVKVQSDRPAKVRSSGGSDELLVPLTFKDGKARIVQEYAW